MNTLNDLYVRLSSIAVFRNVLKLKTMGRLLTMLKEQSPEACGEFVHSLYRHGTNLSDYVIKAVTEDENAYLLRKARRDNVSPVMENAVRRELGLFEEISMLTTENVRTAMGYMGYLPEWENTHYDFHALYAERLDQLFTKGYGIFAKYTAFMLKDHVIEPVLTPDPQRLSQLPAYETQRKKVIDNTLALIKGKPAANCLLYGDAGTGKSSTVKAVVNEFADRGLRLIELKKSQLHELPDVMDAIADNPLKFIIFIDDLSFSSDDADFGALKAVLEGSIASKASNAVIYATSNRRHLVKESFAEFAPWILIISGVLKLVLTNICIKSGWKGGHFFPVIFCGVSIGYGVAMLGGLDTAFCAAVVTAGLLGVTMKKPLAVTMLLLLCFDARVIPWILLAAFLGSIIPTKIFGSNKKKAK